MKLSNAIFFACSLTVLGCLSAQAQTAQSHFRADSEMVEYDSEQVRRLLNAAERGVPVAHTRLGDLYFLGRGGVEQNFHEAAAWLRKAADLGLEDAQVFLGSTYTPEQEVLQNDNETVIWLQKLDEVVSAITQGNPLSAKDAGNKDIQAALGGLYDRGVGLPKDRAEAAKRYQKAAELGHPLAQLRLGVMYSRSDEGVSRDYQKSLVWLLKAAEQGSALAQGMLGEIYTKGHGVTKDNVQAYYWYERSHASGNRFSRMFLSGLKNDMTESEIELAQMRLKEYFEQKSK